MALGNEVATKNDPEKEEAEEEEEEEELVDPMDGIRDACKETPAAIKYQQILEDCNSRVNSRSNTEEKCHEEMIDYMHAVDYCMAKTVFGKLK